MTIILMIQMHSWGEEVAASPNCWVIKFYNTWQWSISHFSGLNKVWHIVQTVVMPPSLSWSPGLQLVRPPATTRHHPPPLTHQIFLWNIFYWHKMRPKQTMSRNPSHCPTNTSQIYSVAFSHPYSSFKWWVASHLNSGIFLSQMF